MDDFTKQLFPEGEERWIKVLYTDSNKARKVIRLNSPNFSNSEIGFEVTAIGVRDEYTPQVEALLELKKQFNEDYRFFEAPASLGLMNDFIDIKIGEMLQKIILSK